MIASFHNHSDWSDGQASCADMYAAAWAAGVDLFGLSDHLCVYPDGTSPGWSVSPDQLHAYVADVRGTVDRHGPQVIVGVEFDWFENHGELVRPIADRVELDYRIGAVHHVARQQFDVDLSFWTAKSSDERDAVFAAYWNLVREMAESSLFDVAAHIDLPKKLGYSPSSAIDGAVDTALDAIKAHDLVVELNTAGFNKPCADGYPSVDLLTRCRARDIPVTLSSDAHKTEHILFEFERGVRNLWEAGYKEIARFRARERWFEPLDQALVSKRKANYTGRA